MCSWKVWHTRLWKMYWKFQMGLPQDCQYDPKIVKVLWPSCWSHKRLFRKIRHWSCRVLNTSLLQLGQVRVVRNILYVVKRFLERFLKFDVHPLGLIDFVVNAVLFGVENVLLFAIILHVLQLVKLFPGRTTCCSLLRLLFGRKGAFRRMRCFHSILRHVGLAWIARRHVWSCSLYRFGFCFEKFFL